MDEKPGKLSSRFRDTEIVAVMVPFTERTLRDMLKAAVGRWDPEERLWRVKYDSIRGNAGRVERIVKF